MCRCLRYDRCLSTLVCIFVNTLSAGCAHALVYAQFAHWRWGTKVGGFSLSMQDTCCCRKGLFFKRRTDRFVVCISSIFDDGLECASVCVFVCIRTQKDFFPAELRSADFLRIFF